MKFINWLLVFVWAGLIFFLSHQPDLKSGLATEWDFVLRKLAHLSEYAILTYLIFRALNQYQLKNSQVIGLSFLLALTYSISDEYHQSFVFARYGVWTDVLVDSLGILLMIWYLLRKKTF